MGDERHTGREARLGLLRARFMAIAGRRVPPDVVEDVVQDALRVVIEKMDQFAPAELVEGLPRATWSFQVLRHTIGNYYMRTSRRSGHRPLSDGNMETARDQTPMEALEAKELNEILGAALAEMGASHPECGRYLRRLIDGRSPAAIAADEGLVPAVLHRRVYRCRMVLRSILARKGVIV